MPEHSKILIVEDEFILAQDIKNRLISLSYEVVGVSSNGDDALDKAIRMKPDLVLMDIRLEGDKDGIETADLIQKEMGIPVIFLSAYADRETVKRAKMSEPMGYLIKPCEEKELETTIETALYKHQVTQKLQENEQWLSTTLNNVGDAVIRTDADHRVLLMNPVAAGLTGLSEEEATGRKLHEVIKIIDEETRREIRDAIYHQPDPHHPVIAESRFILVSTSGKETYIDYSSTPVKDEKGNMTGLVLVIHDITERRRSERIIERRLKLEKALDDIARMLLKNSSPDFSEILKTIGKAMNADRGFIFEFRDNRRQMDSRFEWYQENLDPLMNSLQDIDTSFFSQCMGKFERGESIFVPDHKYREEAIIKEIQQLLPQQVRMLQIVPLFSARGKLTGFMGFSSGNDSVAWSEQDLQILRVVVEMIGTHNARKIAEDSLKQSESRFRSLIQNSTDLITVVDKQGNFLYVSPSVERILGYLPEELLGNCVFDLIHPQNEKEIREKTYRSFGNKKDLLSLEFKIKHKNGSYRDMEATGKNMLYDRLIEGVVVNSRDITLRKRTEVELIKAKDKAEEMNRLKTTFLANMSHEIRTPLTGILGYASIMQTDLEDEGEREMARRIHDSGKRLLATIDAILDLAKIEADKLDVILKPTNLSKELREAVEMLQPLADQRKLTLECHSSDDIHVLLDPQLFGQVMSNLIGNALKYTHQGGVKVRTELLRETGGQDKVAIHVIDTGVGIAREFLPNIFDEFKQESIGLSRKFEGAGLGLTITKKLVDVMNGEISVESEKGRGSTFTVVFPAVKEMVQYEPYEEIQHEVPELPAFMLEIKPKILLVEDNEDSKIVTENYLNGHFEIHSVDSGERALDYIRRNKYDLILMDINLGDGIDGVEALNRIRDINGYKDIPVLALTAYAMKGDESHYLKLGFSEYLSKPFRKDEITSTINKLLESKLH